ncbi:hypothetical protein T265_05184 [Opisthorchis viverrini]|uniref:EF-hand domain-containing protein n=2 Tax=Opisthorchis viverrini TaxID=6198 RepID=A0A074ZL76_OPIVI|nr:hypothetical protein T265_05184 [Opisthorchis viverrini]KER27821.1 hypothetical protein T265_05184 [Opisthorchis viverrini]
MADDTDSVMQSVTLVYNITSVVNTDASLPYNHHDWENYHNRNIYLMGQKQAKLRQDVVDELVNQTAFTETEIQDWYKGFLKDCPTGHLTIDEFRQIYIKFFPYGEASRFAEYVFRTFDRNRDGVIDFREFLSTVSVTTRGDLNQKLRWAFNMYDLDGDGYISRQDLCDVIASIYTLIGSTIKLPEDEATPERRANKIFEQMDSDHDNRLSFEEFCEGVRSDRNLLQILKTNAQKPPQPDSNATAVELVPNSSSVHSILPKTSPSKDVGEQQDNDVGNPATKHTHSSTSEFIPS